MKEEMKHDTESVEDVVDLEAYSKSGKTPPRGKKYKIKVENEYFIFDRGVVTGKEILEKADKIPVECHTLYIKLKNCDFEKINLDEEVDLVKPGIEKFTVKPPEIFNYTVDSEPETTDKTELTPNQILELAGLVPASDFYLVQIGHEGIQISYKDIPTLPVKMKCPAMKFISVFRGETPVS